MTRATLMARLKAMASRLRNLGAASHSADVGAKDSAEMASRRDTRRGDVAARRRSQVNGWAKRA